MRFLRVSVEGSLRERDDVRRSLNGIVNDYDMIKGRTEMGREGDTRRRGSLCRLCYAVIKTGLKRALKPRVNAMQMLKMMVMMASTAPSLTHYKANDNSALCVLDGDF